MISSSFDNRTNINFNFNFGSNGVGGAGELLTDLLSFLKPVQGTSNDFFSNFQGIRAGDGGCCHPAPIEKPVIQDNGGGLKVDGNKVTTAGGYSIEPMSQYEWKITGPDGKETRVWGDPHVAEGDGGTWDFNANSTFVLGDGTKINVTTVPFNGNDAGATVTGKLEIISGNDRVEINDIDKGKGTIGTVTQDGYAHANSFQGQVFVQGKETDDWSIKGKEILGNESGKDNFKTGGELEAGRPRQNPTLETTRGIDQMFDRFMNNRSWLMNSLVNIFKNAFTPQNRLGSNPYTGNSTPPWQSSQRYDRNTHRSNITNAFRDMSRMFDMLSRLSRMSDRLDVMRHRLNLHA
jgi:hypothetical protein